MSRQASIKKNEIPEGWSEDAADFINKVCIQILIRQLLQRKPVNRLGLRGANEVKEHSWFKDYPWKALYEKKVVPKYVPKIGDNFDKKYCEQPDKIGEETKERYEKYLREESTQTIFKDFYYYNEENDHPISISKIPTHRDNKIVIKKDYVKKELLRENNSYTLLKKNNDIKQFSVNPIPNLVVGNMFEKMKMEKSTSSIIEKSASSMIDNRFKLKKNTASMSTSSLVLKNSMLKNSRQISNLGASNSSISNSNIIGSTSGMGNTSRTSNLSSHAHKRTSSSIKPISINYNLMFK